ncbi:MAG: cytochrome ubiquinol oxidase subunit I, partial [Alphaproteobacteria bacterium]
RLVHMVLAAYQTTAFVVGAVGAWHLLRGRDGPPARTMLSMAMWMAIAVTPVQIAAGDLHGLNTLEHQPAKIAAMEGHWETRKGAPLILFGLPDMAREETRWAVEIPRLGSLVLTHDWDGEIRGLKEWPPGDRPNAALIFWTFRIMVGVGLCMLALGAAALLLRWRRRLYDHRWFLRAAVAMGPAGFVAVLAGWITTESGRQPWIVHGLMRTADAASAIDAGRVALSLSLFVVVYVVVFGFGIRYILHLMGRPPEGEPPTPADPAVGLHPMKAAAE